MEFKPDMKIFECDAVDLAVTPEGDMLVFSHQIAGTKEPLHIGLPRKKMEALHYQLGLLLGASFDKPPTGVPGFVKMTDVVGADASATDAPGKIALSLAIEGGSVHYFRLPKELSAALRPRMRNAELSHAAKPPRAKH